MCTDSVYEPWSLSCGLLLQRLPPTSNERTRRHVGDLSIVNPRRQIKHRSIANCCRRMSMRRYCYRLHGLQSKMTPIVFINVYTARIFEPKCLRQFCYHCQPAASFYLQACFCDFAKSFVIRTCNTQRIIWRLRQQAVSTLLAKQTVTCLGLTYTFRWYTIKDHCISTTSSNRQ